MEYRVLGPIEALDGERRLPLGGPKQRALLGVLLLSANRVVPRDELVDAVWPEGAPPTAATALQVYVSRLRKLLPPGSLETRPPGYVLHAGPGELDLERFEQLTAADRAAEALELWRGPPLAGLELGGPARVEVQRLEERRLAVLEDRVEADLTHGRHVDLIAELEALVSRNPLRERLRGQLMLALYRSGRQAEALEHYRALRLMLRDELGLEPDASLRRLHTEILRQSGQLEAATPAAVLFAILTPSESDPAAVRDLLEQAAEAASAELRERGATVERGLAGALLARLEPDAARALAAATAVRDRLEAELGGAVRARIGVELGDVLGGKGGLSGLPVATAARLAGSAEPGEILVGEGAASAAGLEPPDGT